MEKLKEVWVFHTANMERGVIGGDVYILKGERSFKPPIPISTELTIYRYGIEGA